MKTKTCLICCVALADLIWFPAQWPETYSYTLSACLLGGWPVVAPDLGAFAEKVKGTSLELGAALETVTTTVAQAFAQCCVNSTLFRQQPSSCAVIGERRRELASTRGFRDAVGQLVHPCLS